MSEAMRYVIARLFAEAPKLTDEDGSPRADQAPALECHVVLTSGQQMQGALSTTPEGTLRMMTPNQQIDPRTRQPMGLPVMVESFFDYDQVSCIAVVRPVTVDGAKKDSPIIHSS